MPPVRAAPHSLKDGLDFTPHMLQASLYILLAVRNYYVLARVLLWLLSHCAASPNMSPPLGSPPLALPSNSTHHHHHLHVLLLAVVGMVRACDEAFVIMELLEELLTALARACAMGKASDLPPVVNACNALLTELLVKYREHPACKKWADENPHVASAHARAHTLAAVHAHSSSNILPHTSMQIRSVMAACGSIPEPVEAILQSSFSLDKIISGSVQLLSSTSVAAAAGDNGEDDTDGNRSNLLSYVCMFLSLAEPTPAKLGSALKHALTSYIPIGTDP